MTHHTLWSRTLYLLKTDANIGWIGYPLSIMSLAVKMAPDALFGNDGDWDQLIEDIESRIVVPVVGPDLLIRGDDATQNLHQYLASELIKLAPLKADHLGPASTLLDICSHNRTYRDALNRTLRSLISNAKWPPPKPLIQLAQIEHFDFYVCTTFDTLLYDAVKNVREGAVWKPYGVNRKPTENDIALGLRAPVIFQILGFWMEQETTLSPRKRF